MKVRVSVIVPVYNMEKYLSKCLDSLVNQTFEDIEIILINDGSTDNSENIIKEYLERYSKKIVYIKKENEGQGVARNLGIDKARGEYITFVDSDDYVDVTMIEKLYSSIIKEKADISVSRGLIEVRSDNLLINDFIFNNEESVKRYILNNFGPVAKLIKKDIIINNQLYFPSLRAYEDIAVVPLWGLFANGISFVEEPLYYYLIREGSTMKQVKYNNKLEDIYASLDYLYKRVNNNFGDIYASELEWIYIENLLHAASLRFLKFNKIGELKKINGIIKERFPNWNKNKYYKLQNIKYKIICMLFYKEYYWLLKILLKNN